MEILTKDEERIKKILEFLPEEFFDDFLNLYLWNANYHRKHMNIVRKYWDFSKQTFSQFADEALDESKKQFDVSFDKLIEFVVTHFFGINMSDIYILYPDHKNSNDAEKKKFWHKKLDELRKLIDDAELNYKNLFKMMKKYMENKTSEIKSPIKWWEKTRVQIIMTAGALASIAALVFLFI